VQAKAAFSSGLSRFLKSSRTCLKPSSIVAILWMGLQIDQQTYGSYVDKDYKVQHEERVVRIRGTCWVCGWGAACLRLSSEWKWCGCGSAEIRLDCTQGSRGKGNFYTWLEREISPALPPDPYHQILTPRLQFAIVTPYDDGWLWPWRMSLPVDDLGGAVVVVSDDSAQDEDDAKSWSPSSSSENVQIELGNS
jgi:hypothetical protein